VEVFSFISSKLLITERLVRPDLDFNGLLMDFKIVAVVDRIRMYEDFKTDKREERREKRKEVGSVWERVGRCSG